MQVKVQVQLNRLASLIKSRREELGISQADLARRLGVTQVAVLRWEKARTMPDMINVTKLANFVGLSTEELWAYLDGNDNPKEQLNVTRILNALDSMSAGDVALIISAGAQKLARVS
jgi:transcriptional regulator with XRE-family HTH domain